MEDNKNLKDEKIAMLLLLEKYIKNGEKEKAVILADKIKDLNAQLEEEESKKK